MCAVRRDLLVAGAQCAGLHGISGEAIDIRYGSLVIWSLLAPCSLLRHLHAIEIVQRSTLHDEDTGSVAIGLRPEGRLAMLEGTPERRQQEWVV